MRKVINMRAGDMWHDRKRGTSLRSGNMRRAKIVGGDGVNVQVRINGELVVFKFRYFVRRFTPSFVQRYREWGKW